jgi:glucans biosynthesis protein C
VPRWDTAIPAVARRPRLRQGVQPLPSSELAQAVEGVPQRIPSRHFGLDWLRIAAFLLLIFFHIGRYFSPDPWLVRAPAPVGWVEWPMLALEPWRLALLFAVSGYASHALLARSGSVGTFLKARSHRLLLPLGFGLLLLVPPQTWIGLVGQHGYQGSLLHFWKTDWLSFRMVDGVAVPNGEHLWFIGYLWTYTMGLGAVLAFAPAAWLEKARQVAERLFASPHLLLLPMAGALLMRVLVLFTVPERHGLLHDWVNDVTYLPAFLFGFALAGLPSLWPRVVRLRLPALLMALAAYALLAAIEYRYPEGRPHLVQALDRDASLIMAWSMILLMLGVAHQWLNRDHPLRGRLSEAVFPFYLVHQTIIVVTGWWLRGSGLSAWAMFAVLVAATFCGCWLFYEAGRRIAWLRPFTGFAPVAPTRTPAIRPVAEAA